MTKRWRQENEMSLDKKAKGTYKGASKAHLRAREHGGSSKPGQEKNRASKSTLFPESTGGRGRWHRGTVKPGQEEPNERRELTNHQLES
jgi:hypothetical protein